MPAKTDHKKLTPYFTNLTKNVFVLTNMPQILKGALFSRYSRSPKPLRQLFYEEYLSAGLSANNADVTTFLNTKKAEEFYSKWLAEYGDDSIAELGGEHLALENISILATKALEDRRLGVSFLEKSTRYVRFDTKVRGKYLYYRPALPANLNTAYVKAMDLLFDTYSQLVGPMSQFFINKYPKPADVSDKAYAASIRAKACDTLRGLLPLSALTNMGVFANGRAYEYMLTKMFASDLAEVQSLAKSAYAELDKVIHNFIERIKTEKGTKYISYLKDTAKNVQVLSQNYLNSKTLAANTEVKLVDYDEDAVNRTVTGILFANVSDSYEVVYKKVTKMSEKNKQNIISSYYSARGGRWHKVGRAFEEPYYHFEIVSDFGAYKDLERHRVLTQDRQHITCDLGYDVPREIVEAGFEKQYRVAMTATELLYKKLRVKFPTQAQYAVTHAHKIRYRFKLNLREAFHLCELRSSPQGHPSYRRIAQEIYKKINEVHPLLGKAMAFVDTSNPGLERLAAEVRKEQKLQK